MARKTSAAIAPSIQPRFRVYRDKEIVLGPGKVDLLALIAETGSLSEAARRMDMSYNRAWLHVKTMNAGFAEPLVAMARGGASGGGAVLTETGRQALDLYRRLEERTLAVTAKEQAALQALLKS